MQASLQLANQYLQGNGIEFGALNQPLALESKSDRTVVYADRYSKDGLGYTFPEIGEAEIAKIVNTNIILDLDLDKYAVLKQYKFDFFIASHVIEHLVNPLLFLKKLSGVMKPGSILYLAVPDKEYTFDKERPLTTWNHLYWEYMLRVKVLSKAHLKEYIFATSKSPYRLKSRYRRKYFRDAVHEHHIDRSIHVHVWNQTTFDAFINKAIKNLRLGLEILEQIDSNEDNKEVVYLLKKIERVASAR